MFQRLSWILIVVALVAPPGAATWYAHGTHEPDNAEDDPSLNFDSVPPAGAQRVYFNAYTGTSPGLIATLVSPNVGLIQSANEAPALEYHMAILGVWVDCNGDGYVGLAETAQQEYAAALLFDDSVCPAISGDVNVWTPGAHNYNGWVSEYVPIGGVTTDLGDDANDSRIYRDPAAMVWGDFGKPDDPASAGGTCALAPQPRGTYQSTGGFLNWAGCNSGALARWNFVLQGGRAFGTDFDGVESITGPTGLAFPNNDAQDTWADVETFGTEDTANSPASVWDCASGPMLHSGDFVNATAGSNAATVWTVKNAVGPTVGGAVNRADNITVYEPAPSLTGASDPTAPALLNSTQEGLNAASAQENCNTSDDDGHDFYGNNYVFYVGETDFNSVSTANKRAAQWNLAFNDISRDPLITNLPANQGPTPATPLIGGRAGFTGYAPQASNWASPSVLVKAGPRLIALDLVEGTAGLPTPAYFVFYAHVGQVTRDRGFALPGGSGEYASAQCGDNTSGIHNGWNCDVNEWYKNADGSPMPEPRPFARPGQTYELRDVDCHDGRNSLGIALGAPAYGPEPCSPP